MTRTVCHSSPDTQAVGALHRLAIPQEEAALVSKPLQQTLCGSAPDAAKVEGPDQRPFHLHAERRATVRGLRQGVPKHVCVQRVRRQKNKRAWFSHFFYTSATRTMHIFSLCRWRSCVLMWTYFSPLLCSLPSCPTRTNNKWTIVNEQHVLTAPNVTSFTLLFRPIKPHTDWKIQYFMSTLSVGICFCGLHTLTRETAQLISLHNSVIIS